MVPRIVGSVQAIKVPIPKPAIIKAVIEAINAPIIFCKLKFCFVFATAMILLKGQVFFSTSYNSSLFSLHGTLVCLGLILYSIGSKAIPAAELTLLSLAEVIGGIFWVWLPLFGINEVPDTNTIIGGFFLFISLFYYSLIMRWNKRYIGLN